MSYSRVKPEEVDLWIADYNSGMSVTAISNKYDRDHKTIYAHFTNRGVKINYRECRPDVRPGPNAFKSSEQARLAPCLLLGAVLQ